MGLLEEIYQEILNEEARTVDVVDAIKKRYEAKITYKADDDPKGTGVRIIQPVAYGITKAGNPVIRAFEPYGDTKTKVPRWKFFRLDRITYWKPLRNNKFDEPPADQWLNSGAEGKFNENGDNSMKEVYLVADFKGTKERYLRGGLAKYNADRLAKKKAENPFYDMERNIKKSKEMGNVDYMKYNAHNWNNDAAKAMLNQQRAIKNNKGNDASINDMEKAQNFPQDTVQTVGPVKKQNVDTKTQDNTKPLNYQQAQQTTGPVYKNKQQQPLQQPQDTDDLENKIETDSEENNELR